MKLGKLAPKHDARTFKLKKLLLPGALPAPPVMVDWSVKLPTDVGMFKNDVVGDCAEAECGHMIQVWTSNESTTVTPTDDDIIAAYSAITGYDPGDASTDKGTILLDALNYWRQTGIAGHKIGAYVQVDHTNIQEVKTALDLFGGLCTGAALPVSAQSAIGSSWSQVSQNDIGTWGGHALCACAYDEYGITYLTWGKRQMATWDWFTTYADEVYAIVSADWVSGTKPAPNGFDLDTLLSDLAEL